jgi:hypothetical protein
MRQLFLVASATVLIAVSVPAVAAADPVPALAQAETVAAAAFVVPEPQPVDREALAESHTPADDVAQAATAGGEDMSLEFIFYAGIIVLILASL